MLAITEVYLLLAMVEELVFDSMSAQVLMHAGGCGRSQNASWPSSCAVELLCASGDSSPCFKHPAAAKLFIFQVVGPTPQHDCQLAHSA